MNKDEAINGYVQAMGQMMSHVKTLAKTPRDRDFGHRIVSEMRKSFQEWLLKQKEKENGD